MKTVFPLGNTGEPGIGETLAEEARQSCSQDGVSSLKRHCPVQPHYPIPETLAYLAKACASLCLLASRNVTWEGLA